MTWGVLFVGCYGATASTTLAGILSGITDHQSLKLGSYWCAANGDYPSEVYSIEVGGWDCRHSNLHDALIDNAILPFSLPKSKEPTTFPAIIGPADYACRVDGIKPTHSYETDAIDSVRANIVSFRNSLGLERIIVVNTSSPMYCGENAELWSSTRAYALATVTEGCDWVEFTPSDSITPDLLELAKRTGARVAGRDGSTGQTIMKLLLRDYLLNRGFHIDHWFSTNLIGNRDGLVLAHPDYNKTKLRDKSGVLDGVFKNSAQHQVEIQYVPPAGDNKESWDCVHFTGWMQKSMSLRINWQGADSYLAAPLILDIVSSLMHAYKTECPPGLLNSIGIFFKAPQGVENYTYNSLQDLFHAFIERR